MQRGSAGRSTTDISRHASTMNSSMLRFLYRCRHAVCSTCCHFENTSRTTE